MAKASSAAARERANPLATAEVPLYVATELLGAAPGVFRVRLRAQQKSKRVLAEGRASASRPHVAPARHGSAAHCALGRSLNRCSGSALCLFKTCSPSFEFCHNLTVELRSTARLLTKRFAFELQLGLRRKSHGFRRNLRFDRCNCRFFRSGNSSNHLRSRRVS